MKVVATQSFLTLCNSLDCSPPGSSVYGIFQTRGLEWVTVAFSSRSSQPGIVGRFFPVSATKAMGRKPVINITALYPKG